MKEMVGEGKWWNHANHLKASIKEHFGWGVPEEMTWPDFEKLVALKTSKPVSNGAVDPESLMERARGLHVDTLIELVQAHYKVAGLLELNEDQRRTLNSILDAVEKGNVPPNDLKAQLELLSI